MQNRFYELLIWLVLLLGLISSGAVSYWVKLDIDARQHQQFLFYCEETKLRIIARLKAHEQTLISSAALFDASDSVERQEWHIYANRLLLNHHFHGIQGIGFILWVPHEQLTAHIAQVRAEGFPNYSVRPEGEREAYAPIKFIEPFNERNLRAFGYDIYSEPVRRAGAERARDENIVTLTGKITLVQETDKNIQAGLLMFAPVYQKGKPIDTVEQRRAALFGWAYSPFRMNDLFNNILASAQNTDTTQVNLRIYDGSDSQAEHLLYDSKPNHPDNDTLNQRSTVEISNDFNGTVWTLQFEQTTAPNSLDYIGAWITLITDVFVSMLVFLLLRSYLNTRLDAANIAAKLTAQLQESESRFRVLADTAPVMIWLAGLDKLYYQFNKIWLDFTGRTLEQEYGNGWAEGVHPDDLQNCLDIYSSSFDAHLPFKIEYRLRRYDGEYRWILDNGVPRFSDEGVFLGYIGSCIDITEKKQSEYALQKESEKNAMLLRNASDGIHILDVNGNIIEASDSFCTMLGYQREEVIGMNVSQWDVYFSPSERIETLKKLFESPIRSLFETRHLCKDGTIIDVEVSAYPLELNGEPVLFNSSRDITKRKQIAKKLRENEAYLRAIIENEPECIKIVDKQGRLLQMNPAGLAMIEADSLEQVKGQPVLSMIVPEHRLAFAEMHNRVIAGEKQRLEFEMIDLKGGRHWMETHAVPLSKYGDIVLLAVTRDISERKATEQAIYKLAFYDHLTGLPNRRKLLDRLNYAITLNHRANTKFAVFMMDLDRFKAVNDSLGHAAGDDLLKQVAERITGCLRDSDMVARLGGDEFVLVLESLKIPEDAETIALKIIAELTIPFQLSESDSVLIGASIGISIYPQHGNTAEILMDHADTALYLAKDSGRGRFAHFDELSEC